MNTIKTTHIIAQTKGGVGKTIFSTIIATLLHEKDKTLNVYEIDDNNNSEFKSNIINYKSIQIKESEDLLDEVYFDTFSEDANIINLIDCGGGNDTKSILNKLSENDMIGNNYYIPIFDDIDHINNAVDTIKLIRAFDKEANVNLIFNRCFSTEQKDIEAQFIGVFGSEEYEIESRVKELDYDNIFFIPNTNIFSILKAKKISLLDTYLHAIDLVANKHEYQRRWQQEGKESFSRKMKMFRLGKRVIELIEDVTPLKKALKG
jgi:MinD-like ATPase involved in chromosome partitioning or flagellar assembly